MEPKGSTGPGKKAQLKNQGARKSSKAKRGRTRTTSDKQFKSNGSVAKAPQGAEGGDPDPPRQQKPCSKTREHQNTTPNHKETPKQTPGHGGSKRGVSATHPKQS